MLMFSGSMQVFINKDTDLQSYSEASRLSTFYFRSYSWSANICGHKKWILYSPGCEEHLKDKKGNLVFDLRSSEIHNPQKFPDYLKAAQPLVVHQKEGEIIFIPR